uniref:Uncharacterized protein n=1 Tax=Oryza punctata TaxID=4537 RepID=A0A0E0KGA5_ORYPU
MTADPDSYGGKVDKKKHGLVFPSPPAPLVILPHTSMGAETTDATMQAGFEDYLPSVMAKRLGEEGLI